MKSPKLLLVEDDENLGYVTKDNLEENDFQVEWAKDGDQGYDFFLAGTFDLCILDVMLPKRDGFSLGREIKKLNPAMPLFFLTAKSFDDDRIKGLSMGADDYITKPFNINELVLRINNLFERINMVHGRSGKDTFQIGNMIFEPGKLTLTTPSEEIKLTKKQSDLLRLLCLQEGDILKRETALRIIWGKNDYFTGRSMDVFITKLRKYLRSDPEVFIENIHGIGFKLVTPSTIMQNAESKSG